MKEKPYTFAFIDTEGDTRTATVLGIDRSDAYHNLTGIHDVKEVIEG